MMRITKRRILKVILIGISLFTASCSNQKFINPTEYMLIHPDSNIAIFYDRYYEYTRTDKFDFSISNINVYPIKINEKLSQREIFFQQYDYYYVLELESVICPNQYTEYNDSYYEVLVTKKYRSYVYESSLFFLEMPFYITNPLTGSTIFDESELNAFLTTRAVIVGQNYDNIQKIVNEFIDSIFIHANNKNYSLEEDINYSVKDLIEIESLNNLKNQIPTFFKESRTLLS